MERIRVTTHDEWHEAQQGGCQMRLQCNLKNLQSNIQFVVEVIL